MAKENLKRFNDDIRKTQNKKQESRLLEELFYRRDLIPQEKNQRDITPLLVTKAKLPMEFWETGWVFRKIDDNDWLAATNNVFPATLRKDHKGHPGYITREIGNYALELCPLSTKTWTKEKFIPEGSTLNITNFKTVLRSYIVNRASVRLPRYNRLFYDNPEFLGIYPPEQLKS